jgi:hypothetical protein
MHLTFNDDILYSLLFRFGTASAFTPLVFLSKLWEHKWSYGLNDAWQCWIIAFQQPCLSVRGSVEIDADLEDRMLCNPQVASEWCHVKVLKAFNTMR